MSKLSTPVVIVIGVVAVAIVIVAGLVANSALNEDDEDDAPVVAQTATEDGGAVTTTVEADEKPLTEAELADVEAAALRVVGGGTVTDADPSDDPGEAYEVEVVTDQGEVDVALDENLERVPNQAYDD